MQNYNSKEKNKTRRTIIKGFCYVVAALITTIGVIISKYEPSSTPKETDMLCDTSVLYDGESYLEYKYSNYTFSIGSQGYNCGFTIQSPNSIQNSTSTNGFVLMDLDKKYSEVSFSVGRVEGDLNSDTLLVIYIDNKYLKEIRLQGKSSSQDVKIDVLNAKNLRLELKSEKDNVYGFANVLLHK